MAAPIRIKRRAGGAAGAPESLLNAELAFNEVDDVLYYGKGTGGEGGTATQVIPIGGPGAFVRLTGNQSINGLKTFEVLPRSSATPTNAQDFVTRGWVLGQIGDLGGGTVMEVGLQMPLGFQVSNSPITSSGDLVAEWASGYKAYTEAESNKLATIANNATANSTDATLLNRANHTGTQAISTITSLQSTLDSKIPSAQKGVANGVATLDSAGKVPVAQLPESVIGGMKFIDTWNASTNTPTIPAAAPANTGHYYVVAIGGTTDIDGTTDWEAGDWIVSNGSTWTKIDNTDQVSSVNGKKGIVVLDLADFSSTGSMAYQSASSVAITGGTINNVVIDGGTF